jgi:hypothetical protein
MNEYKVFDMSNNMYDTIGIRLNNGKTSYFFKNKGSRINEVIVVKDPNIKISNGQVVLCLKGINNSNDIRNIMSAFRSEINVRNIKFKIIVNSKEEEKQILEGINGFNISYEIIRSKEYMSNNSTIEQYKEMLASGSSNQIKKEDNGIERQYVTNNGKVYDDNYGLSLDEEKKILFSKWLKDPNMSNKIVGLSKEELDNLLMESVTVGRKKYYMENADNNTSLQNKSESTANSVAYSNDGKYNAELGIVENSSNVKNQYSTVEEYGDDKVRVVSPEVSNSMISSDNRGVVGTNTSSGSSDIVNNQVDLSYEEEQNRDIDTVYYVDNDSYIIYDSNGNEIGMLGSNGYLLNTDDNSLYKDGRKIGYIGDINSMSYDMNKDKPKVRTLKKPEDNAAFVSFPIILLVIAMLFLIVSVVLFVLT